jgi:hypothetical protein
LVKKYQANSYVSLPIDNAEQFANDLGNIILGYQNKGLQVEIQYQQTESRVSALVLGYIVVTKL